MAPSFRTSQLLGLLDRMRAGDPAAADELFRHAGDRLERLARKMLRSFRAVGRWEQTTDVVQNASLRLLRALQAVRPNSTADFFRLAGKHLRYELLDLTRHYRRLNDLHHSDGGAGSAGTPAHEPLDPAPSQDELEKWCEFHQKIDQLPDKEREVVDLHFYQGLPKKKVAELLDVTPRTVERRWCDALERLGRLDKPGS